MSSLSSSSDEVSSLPSVPLSSESLLGEFSFGGGSSGILANLSSNTSCREQIQMLTLLPHHTVWTAKDWTIYAHSDYGRWQFSSYFGIKTIPEQDTCRTIILHVYTQLILSIVVTKWASNLLKAPKRESTRIVTSLMNRGTLIDHIPHFISFF